MESIIKLNEMELPRFLMYYKKLSNDERIKLITNKEILNLANDKFNMLVLNMSLEEAEILINNELLYDKIFNLPYNSVKRTILNLLGESKPDILKLIIESPYALKYSEKIQEYIYYLSDEKFNKLLEFINFENIMNSISLDYVKKYFDSKLNIGSNYEELLELLINKINNKQVNPLLIYKIKDYNQFILFSKFGVLIEQNENCNSDCVMLPSNLVLPIDAIMNVKGKYIIKLMEMLKQKGEAESYKYLEVALKLYFIFGFDDAKKILDDKFSKLNESSLIKISDFTFKDLRREYRAKNQKKFYFYGMEQDVVQSLMDKKNTIFENLLYEPTLESVEVLRKEFLLLLHDYDGKPELNEKIKEKLCEKINERESIAKVKLTEEIKKRVDEKISRDNILDTNRLYDLFNGVDLYKITEDYDDVILEKLGIFLLGNKKNNNDCLFRLIVNKEALGLNKNLSTLINNFDLLMAITHSNELSLNSVLDVIDILKMDLYELRPNEQDITLETLTRIINSTEYRTDDSLDVAREICKLHVERKQKTFSTIPTVSGKTEDFEYFVAPFDAEYLLAAGNDSKNCMRISGLGQDFFEYCLKNQNAVFIYLIGKDGKKYVCPTVRSGNAINCNGIDPVIPPESKNSVLKALSCCFKDIIESSYIKNRDHFENIEIATVSDLHLTKYFSMGDFEKYNLGCVLPLGQSCYCDYNKKDINHYVLAKSSTYTSNYYYTSYDEFYQKRDQDYEFDVNREYDKERLSLIINSIYYSSIDFQNKQGKEKLRLKRDFEPLDIEKFKYITGNKDWFVAIDENYNIISCLLPYDKRAKKNYFEAVAKAPMLLEKMIGDTYGGKNL